MKIFVQDLVPNIWADSKKSKVLLRLLKDMVGRSRILYQQVDFSSFDPQKGYFPYRILIVTQKNLVTVHLNVPAQENSEDFSDEIHVSFASITGMDVSSMMLTGASTDEGKVGRHGEVAPYLHAGVRAEGGSPFDLGSSGWSGTDSEGAAQTRLCWGSIKNVFHLASAEFRLSSLSKQLSGGFSESFSAPKVKGITT